MQNPDRSQKALDRLSRPLRLTLLGIMAERVVRLFWPVWTLALLAVSALAFGVQDAVPLEPFWIGLSALCLGMIWFGWRGYARFRMPTRDDALERMDALLPGRPLAALRDTQAIGSADDASRKVWDAHIDRMAERAAAARAVEPDLRLSRRDPFALRYIATIAFGMALLFGSFWRVADAPGPVGIGSAQAAVQGPSWEGWAEPPAYTNRPGIYLGDIPEGRLELPEGSRVTLRFYGEIGTLTLAETVSGRTGDPGSATEQRQEFEVAQAGTIAIGGPGGRRWDVALLPDAAPKVEINGEMEVAADGLMSLPFHATDDNSVVAGRAEITLDMEALDRRFGLATPPEPREPIIADLPMPLSGNRADFIEKLSDDFSEHAWAQLPVRITLTVEDARGQTGTSEPLRVALPGKRFFHPLSAAIIEMRRDLLWTRENAPRSLQILRAVTHKPEGFITNERAFLMLRVLLRRLDVASESGMTPEQRDEFAAALWDIALEVEEGELEDAKAALERAQERLSEAIRNGASKEEIDQLMQDLQEATDEYLNQLAQKSERESEFDNADNNQEQTQITGDQIQQMMDEIQRLMEEGRMAEAQQKLQELNELLQNLQVTQGEGNGQGGPGQQAQRGLGDALRKQQDLSDDTFRDQQQGRDPSQGQEEGQGQEGQGQEGPDGQGQQPGQQPGGDGRQGQGQAEQPGQEGQDGQGEQPGQGQQGGRGNQRDGQGADGQGSLAERQQALRREVERQRGNLPGTEQGENARRSLDRAARAMEEAERALRNGDGQGAIDRQADAMDALRDGIRDLGEQTADNRPPPNQPGNGDTVYGRGDPNGQRDPLGREIGENGMVGSDQQMLQGEDVYRRARDLLDEIRRRSADRTRPDTERSYLERLLDKF